MDSPSHKDDIRIGENEWIEFIDLEGRYNQGIEIDHLLEGLSSLWEALEQFCVSACCGIHAFDFYPDTIREVTKDMDIQQLRVSLEKAISAIAGLQPTVVTSLRLNNLFDKITFLNLLTHIKTTISY